MQRDIIKINEELCDGCGDCVIGCLEGALKIIDGKAKLVKEDFCDGFGDCVGVCHSGALTIEKRDANAFDMEATKKYLQVEHGEQAVKKMEQSQKKHSTPEPKKEFSGCPLGSMLPPKKEVEQKQKPIVSTSNHIAQAIPSELDQWPVQLHLISPQATYFKNKELVILSTCGPVACADIHWRYLRGRSVVMACPKLDKTGPYVEKLSEIFKEKTIPKVSVVVMEVPCCGGLSRMVAQAKKISDRTDLVVEIHMLSVKGELMSVNNL